MKHKNNREIFEQNKDKPFRDYIKGKISIDRLFELTEKENQNYAQ